MLTSLVNMKLGETGIVRDIHGGSGAAERIQNMGIRIGKKIKKEGPDFGRGPQTIMVGHFRVAIGFGMASKIMVEIERK